MNLSAQRTTTDLVDSPENRVRHLITCPCGLTRALPLGIAVGDPVTLLPCPRCGSPLVGTFLGDKVEA